MFGIRAHTKNNERIARLEANVMEMLVVVRQFHESSQRMNPGQKIWWPLVALALTTLSPP